MITISNARKFEKEVIRGFKDNALKQSGILRKVIKDFIDKRIEFWFNISPTVRSLLNGVLRSDLGLTEAEIKVDTMLQIIQQSVKVSVRSLGDTQLAINVQVLPNGMETLLLFPTAQQDATRIDGRPGKVASIPWLYWLISQGSNVVVPDYYVKRENPIMTGRSGKTGFMFPTHVDHEEPFTIHPDHRGVEGDNFITHILEKVQFDIERGIWGIVLPVLTRTS